MLSIDDLTDMKARAKIHVNVNTNCWEWTGHLAKGGYAQIKRDGRTQWAHRYLYELMVSRIGENVRVLDHLCRVRACVNPDHMELVTQQQNVRRGLAAITAPLPDEIHARLATLLEDAYRLGVLDGLRQALGRDDT